MTGADSGLTLEQERLGRRRTNGCVSADRLGDVSADAGCYTRLSRDG